MRSVLVLAALLLGCAARAPRDLGTYRLARTFELRAGRGASEPVRRAPACNPVHPVPDELAIVYTGTVLVNGEIWTKTALGSGPQSYRTAIKPDAPRGTQITVWFRRDGRDALAMWSAITGQAGDAGYCATAYAFGGTFTP